MADSEAREIAGLAGSDWAASATELLADLGFSLINSNRPEAPSGSHLLVEFRASPTERHFDPETLSYYAVSRGRPRIVELGLADVAPPHPATATRDVLWGHLHITDRLRVQNRFLTFGGTLRIGRLDATAAILDLASPGPIVRWGGHSQGTDPLATEIGAFFGRLIVAVDFQLGTEARLAAVPPAHLYVAFLLDTDRRLDRITRRTRSVPALERWVEAEGRRLRAADGNAWRAGESLLEELQLEA
jgi:hypothetical protein